jgi:hypothetical protein
MALLSTPAYAPGQLLAEYVDVLGARVSAHSQSGSSERERGVSAVASLTTA